MSLWSKCPGPVLLYGPETYASANTPLAMTSGLA